MQIKELFADKVFTISNCLSITRVFLVPFFGYFLYHENATGVNEYEYFTLFAAFLMILTDFLDGYIARMLRQVSKLGQFLDPISDKIAITPSSIILHIYRDFPLWMVISITLRDIYSITGGVVILSKRGMQAAPNFFG